MPNASPSRDKQENTSEIESNTFPYLNFEFLWNADGELEYQVHQKPYQKLKYMNKGSTHTNAMFNAIPSGIFYRLAKLTSIMKKNAQTKIDEWYVGHHKALSKAELDPKIFPTLKEIWKKADASKLSNDAKQETRSEGRERTTKFCKGFSMIWRENIYKFNRKLGDSNGIKLLHTRMSYHIPPNLGELLKLYLVSKVRRVLASKDFLDR